MGFGAAAAPAGRLTAIAARCLLLGACTRGSVSAYPDQQYTRRSPGALHSLPEPKPAGTGAKDAPGPAGWRSSCTCSCRSTGCRPGSTRSTSSSTGTSCSGTPCCVSAGRRSHPAARARRQPPSQRMDTEWSVGVVHLLRALGDLGAEGVGVPLQRGLDRRVPLRGVLEVVAAVLAVAVEAVLSRREALAVPAAEHGLRWGAGAKGRAGGGGAHSLRQREFLQLHCRLGCGFAGLFVGLAIILKRWFGALSLGADARR